MVNFWGAPRRKEESNSLIMFHIELTCSSVGAEDELVAFDAKIVQLNVQVPG